MKIKASNIWKTTVEYLYLSAAATITAVGIYFFEFLNHFSSGGISGLSMILGAVFPQMSAASFMLIINVLLLILGFLIIGRDFGVKTCYCSALISVETFLLERLFPLTAPLTDEPMLEAGS